MRAGLGVNPGLVLWGVGLVDLDNDGLRDLVQTSGHVYADIARIASNESYAGPRLIYRNLGGGQFEDVTAIAGPGATTPHASRGAAFGDFENDGDMDILVMNMNAPPSLLRNDLEAERHWIEVKLRGTVSNRSAVGAQVTVRVGETAQTAVVVSQSSFLSVNDRRLHFGLGATRKVDRILVRWPNGEKEEFPGAAADRLVVLVEGSGRIQTEGLSR